MDTERIASIFLLMEYDELTESELDLVISFESQFNDGKRLSDKQVEILEEIFKRAAGRIEWSRHG